MSKPRICVVGAANIDLVSFTSRQPAMGETLSRHFVHALATVARPRTRLLPPLSWAQTAASSQSWDRIYSVKGI